MSKSCEDGKSKKPTRTFDKHSFLTAAPVAANYMGMPATTLLHSANGTVCLNEFRITVGNRVYYYTAQVMLHTAQVAIYGECDAECKVAARRAIEAAQRLISETSQRQPAELPIM